MSKKFNKQCPECKSKNIKEIYESSEYNDISYIIIADMPTGNPQI